MPPRGDRAPGARPPRDLAPGGAERIGEVLERHLAAGLHGAAQVAVYRDGVLRLSLAAGHRPDAGGRALTVDDWMLWFSATKPVTAVGVLLLAERGVLDLDRPIAEIWPEFAQGGKEACTTRHVLTHRGGFPVFPRDFDWSRIDDWAAVTAATAAIPAAWPPGEAVGYHPVTYGFVLGEVMRRVDGRRPRDLLREELFAPLGMAAALGTGGAPGAVPPPVPVEARSEVTLLDPLGSERRTSDVVRRFGLPATLRGELPAANALGTAEALARFYAMLEQQGTLDGVRILRPETVRQATTVAVRTDADRSTTLPAAYGLGFLVDGLFEPFTEPGVFGHTGQQSTIGYADPARGVAVAYLTNGLHGPAEVQLRYAEMALAVQEACSP